MGEMADRLSWKDSSVLVTGGSGFLGRNLIARLLKIGARITNLDLIIPKKSWSGEEKFYLSDVRNYEAVERVVVESKPNCVFHLAALTQVVDAKEIPLQSYATNIMGTVNVLEAMRRTNRMNVPIIVASSDKAYGEAARDLPANETTPLDPFHPYDVSKASADFIARSYATEYGLSVAITRCGNIYGPGDTNWQRLIPGALRAAFLGTSFHIRSNGKLVREYNFVDDILEAYFLIAEALASGWAVSGRPWTISDPMVRMSVDEVIQACEIAAGYPIARVYLHGAKDEGRDIRLDAININLIGWSPRMSLPDGLAITAKWLAAELGIP